MLQQFARFSKIHTMLANYTKAVIMEYTRDGTPVQRPMFFVDESSDAALHAKYQYMYGPDLVVAPILTQGATHGDVYLPRGTWIHLWHGGDYSGLKTYKNISAPLGQPVVFYNNESTYKSMFEAIRKIHPVPVPPTAAPTTPTALPCVNSAVTSGSRAAKFTLLTVIFTLKCL